MTAEIVIHRAGPRDVGAMAAFLNRARRGKPKVDRVQVLQSFGDQGYMLAQVDGEIRGLAGWHTEDFIARIGLVVISPAVLRRTVGRALVDAVCDAASELMCEVALLFAPHSASGRERRFYRSCGFQETALEELIPAWRKAAVASMPENSLVMTRKLRDRRVMRPV